MKILILGNGYLGNRCKDTWGDEAIIADKYINTKEDVLALLDEHKPDAVLNSAGIVGKPNVDWCDSHPLETIVGNTKLPIVVAEACQEKNIYLLHMGTGCIFYGDSPHEDKKWRESDMANPAEVTYTRSKYAADLALSNLKNVGIARIRMPVDNIPSKANLIDKVTAFPKVVDVENSVTIVEDMIDVFYKLLTGKHAGIFHVVNPGVMKHRELVEMYKEYVDSEHTNEWITPQELLDQGLIVKLRSNNIMSSENLEKVGIHMREVHEALRDTMQKYAKAKKEGLNKVVGEVSQTC
jgi:dTDP-4-dehydrorhamnose reductase